MMTKTVNIQIKFIHGVQECLFVIVPIRVCVVWYVWV